MLFGRGLCRDKILYTTAALTSEMVIKTAMMGIPALVSRSGFTAGGLGESRSRSADVDRRMKGTRFICLAGERPLIRVCRPDRSGITKRSAERAAHETATWGDSLQGGSDAYGRATKGCLQNLGAKHWDHVIKRLTPQVAACGVEWAKWHATRFAGAEKLPVCPRIDALPTAAGCLQG